MTFGNLTTLSRNALLALPLALLALVLMSGCKTDEKKATGLTAHPATSIPAANPGQLGW
jgi:hypothetical protein